MVKPELGTKRQCPQCSAPFYDLNKHPAECPKCHHSFDAEQPVKKKAKRKLVPAPDVQEKISAARKKPVAGDEAEIDLPEFDDIDIIEDLDDLNEVDVEEVGGVKSKKPSGTADEDDEDEDSIIDEELNDEDDLLDQEEEESDEEEDSDDR